MLSGHIPIAAVSWPGVVFPVVFYSGKILFASFLFKILKVFTSVSLACPS